MKVSLSNIKTIDNYLNNINCLKQSRLHTIIMSTCLPLKEQESVQTKKRL